MGQRPAIPLQTWSPTLILLREALDFPLELERLPLLDCLGCLLVGLVAGKLSAEFSASASGGNQKGALTSAGAGSLAPGSQELLHETLHHLGHCFHAPQERSSFPAAGIPFDAQTIGRGIEAGQTEPIRAFRLSVGLERLFLSGDQMFAVDYADRQRIPCRVYWYSSRPAGPSRISPRARCSACSSRPRTARVRPAGGAGTPPRCPAAFPETGDRRCGTTS